jgi:hypothetical protein
MKRKRLPAIPRMKGSFTGPSVKFLTSWSDLPREADYTNDDGSDPDEDLYTGAEKLIRSKLGEGRTNPSFVPSDRKSDPYSDDAERIGRPPRNPKLTRRLGDTALVSTAGRKVSTTFGASVRPSLSDTLAMDTISKGRTTGGDPFTYANNKKPWNSQDLLNHNLFWGNLSNHPKAKEASSVAVSHARHKASQRVSNSRDAELKLQDIKQRISGHADYWSDKARSILIRKALKSGIISKAGLHPVTKKMQYLPGDNLHNFINSFTDNDIRSHDAHEHGTTGAGTSGFGEMIATGLGDLAKEIHFGTEPTRRRGPDGEWGNFRDPIDLHHGSKFYREIRGKVMRGFHEIGHGRG